MPDNPERASVEANNGNVQKSWHDGFGHRTGSDRLEVGTPTMPPRTAAPNGGLARGLWQSLFLVLLGLLVWMGYREWRDEAQALARSGVERCGLPFLTVCTALVGVAPMPYSTGALVMAFTFGGAPWWQTALAASLASVVGGFIGYLAGWSLGPWRFRRLFGARVFRAGRRIFRKFGVLTTGLAVLIPVPFSSICWLGGIYRVSLLGFLSIILVTRLARFALLARLGAGI